jgi:branched-chain amino acid aminotransferase
MPQVWLNGSFVDDAAAGVSLRDAGLLHGAGVFTTMRTAAGGVFRIAEHLARLRASCEALSVPLQFSDDVLVHAAVELLGRNQLSDARLRLTVTRGTISVDAAEGPRSQPNVFITAAPFEAYPAAYYEKGMTVMLVDEQKLNPYDVQAGHKTLDYFSRLSALREASRRGAGEALWFNIHNYLQSGSISNLFIVENQRLITPPTAAELRMPAVARDVPYSKSNVLPGILRAAVIEQAAGLGFEVIRASIDVKRLLESTEVFLTNSIMGVMPVCRIERKAIGEDKPGPVTRAVSGAIQLLQAGA